ncbi:MAG: hypothetical protein ABJG47_14630 [Ekhidna sp.]
MSKYEDMIIQQLNTLDDRFFDWCVSEFEKLSPDQSDTVTIKHTWYYQSERGQEKGEEKREYTFEEFCWSHTHEDEFQDPELAAGKGVFRIIADIIQKAYHIEHTKQAILDGIAIVQKNASRIPTDRQEKLFVVTKGVEYLKSRFDPELLTDGYKPGRNTFDALEFKLDQTDLSALLKFLIDKKLIKSPKKDLLRFASNRFKWSYYESDLDMRMYDSKSFTDLSTQDYDKFLKDKLNIK